MDRLAEKVETGDIAEIFADFFETLHAGRGTEIMHQDEADTVEAVTVGEIRHQLAHMRPRKAADERGIIAEFLNKGSELLLQMIAEIFTAILNQRAMVPDYWKASSIRVIFKKGDERLPENYQPICIIPSLY